MTARPMQGAAAGVAAGVLGLGAGELVAAPLPGDSSPVLVVGTWLIDRSTPGLKTWAIETFGTQDKPVIIVSVVAVLLVLLAAAGALGSRRTAWGVGAFLALALVDAVIVATSRTAGAADLLAVAALAVVGCLALVRLLALPGPSGTAEAEAPDGFDRRRFLIAAGAVGGLGVAATGLAQLWPRVETGRDDVRLPEPADPAPALPAGADLVVAGLTPHLTRNPDFYRVDITLGRTPRLPVSQWQLPITGMVKRRTVLTYEDLLAMPLVERRITLACVSNPVGGEYIGNATWLGVPVRHVLARVGLDPRADAVRSSGADGITIGTPLSALTDPGRDALFAVGMNGVPLPLEHGFPVRMVVPGLYGFVSATKWLTGFEVTRFDDFKAYWSTRGWSEQAPVKIGIRVDVPQRDAVAGTVTVAGVAWAQHRGIARVEVQVDGGPWREAELATEDSADTWRQWRYAWSASPGDHLIRVRATDGLGETQTAARQAPAPDGATGWPSYDVSVD